MSLDVYLEGEPEEIPCVCECGHRHTKTVAELIYFANITHNLENMAREAGIYMEIWRPDEIGVTKAKQLIEPLRSGLSRLKGDPERFKKLNASNGWGLYEHFVPFVADYLLLW